MDRNEAKEFASRIFYNFVTSTEKRLRFGVSQRNKMKEAMKKGENFHGYRADWIVNSANEVLETLTKSAERFNNTHFNDLISVDDMVDVLNAASTRILNVAKNMKAAAAKKK